MPIYEYICGDCDHHFELIVHSSTRPACRACGSESLRKQPSVFAVSARVGAPAMPKPMGACGSCGDPRGPGACSMN